ncbi:MAG TPA: hypothetical protein VHY91_09420 [Pirellulales bacterium]|jgi:hypothetical protein|nr:hypothetical protein [Pirellulales bacterium]
MGSDKPPRWRVWLPLLAGGIASLAVVPAMGQSSDSSPGLLSRAKQVFAPDRAAPPTQNVSGARSAVPLEPAQAKRPAAPAAKNDPSAQTTSWWQRFSRKPRRTAYDFWSQDRLNP